MTVIKINYGNWTTLTGTLVEIVGSLGTDGIHKEKVVALAVDDAGTAYFAVYSNN